MKVTLVIPDNENVDIVINKITRDDFDLENMDSYCKKKNGGVEITNFFSKKMKVSDTIRAIVQTDKTGKIKEAPSFGDWKVSKYSTYKTIVVILESPHKDEYCLDSNYVLHPCFTANSKGTRTRIMKQLGRMFSKLELCGNAKYRFIFCNPIPYQCSLWHLISKTETEPLNKKVRNKVWCALWKDEHHEFPTEFQQRLESYNPDIIINACTYALKQKIRDFFQERYELEAIYETFHPSVWRKNSKIMPFKKS